MAAHDAEREALVEGAAAGVGIRNCATTSVRRRGRSRSMEAKLVSMKAERDACRGRQAKRPAMNQAVCGCIQGKDFPPTPMRRSPGELGRWMNFCHQDGFQRLLKIVGVDFLIVRSSSEVVRTHRQHGTMKPGSQRCRQCQARFWI